MVLIRASCDQAFWFAFIGVDLKMFAWRWNSCGIEWGLVKYFETCLMLIKHLFLKILILIDEK